MFGKIIKYIETVVRDSMKSESRGKVEPRIEKMVVSRIQNKLMFWVNGQDLEGIKEFARVRRRIAYRLKQNLKKYLELPEWVEQVDIYPTDLPEQHAVGEIIEVI